MKKTLILSCALALAGLSNAAMAADGQGFIRGEIGRSDVDVSVDGFGSASDNDTAYSIRGGYFFNANVAVEGFYSNLYSADIADIDADLQGFGAGVVLKKNFGPNNTGFFIGGRAGLARFEAEIGGEDDHDNTFYAGVGAGYDFSEAFGLSLNYDFNRPEFGDIDVDADTLTLAGEFRF